MNDLEFSAEVEHLISLRVEGDYWDFKMQWHTYKSDLLIDIICMANNLVNRDGYIIIGVMDSKSDHPGEVIGVEGDAKRKDQNQLINFLRDKKFRGGVRPTVYLKTIIIQHKTVDVIIVKNTNTTPFYLLENLEDDGRSDKYVKCRNIYTRLGDTNTPKDKTADVDKEEYLWKKRFGIDLTPFARAKFLLQNPKDWLPMGTDGIHSTDIPECKNVWFNKHYPEYTISYSLNESSFKKGQIDVIEQTIYWMKRLIMPLHNAYIYHIQVKYFSTIIYSTFAVFADNYRFKRVLWKNKTIQNPDKVSVSLLYSYIEQDSLEFLLDNWLCINSETVWGTEEANLRVSTDMSISTSGNPYSVVPVFNDCNEHHEFYDYIMPRINDLFEIVGNYSFEKSEYHNSTYIMASYPDYIDYLCSAGETLVKWLYEMRRNQNK